MCIRDSHNTTDLPALYWAGIPGNEADFPAEETFYTFTGQAPVSYTHLDVYKRQVLSLQKAIRIENRPDIYLDNHLFICPDK